MTEEESEMDFPIDIHADDCGECRICPAACPYEAIEIDPERNVAVLDQEKCRICGICAPACPIDAIDTYYYDKDALRGYLESKMTDGADTLVMYCRGSAPSDEEIVEMIGVEEFIPMAIPCIGRMPLDTYMDAVNMGIEHIFVIACEENFCRFTEGAETNTTKMLTAQMMLEDIGYPEDTVTLLRNTLVAEVDRDACIGCGNCFALCPFDAVTMESPGISNIDPEECRGCGICVPYCTGMAIELKKSEYEPVSKKVESEVERTEPKLMVFGCQWSEFRLLDDIYEEHLPEDIGFIELPCSGRIDPLHVLEAFKNGAEGVLIVTCPEDLCRLEEGSKHAHRRAESLKALLEEAGIDPNRLQLMEATPSIIGSFANALEHFKQSMKEVGTAKKAEEGTG